MFHVIFNSRFENSISTVTIPFSTEVEADEAIYYFESQSDAYISKKATRLYKESFEFSVDWADGTNGILRDIVRGYDTNQVHDEFIKKHKIPITIVSIKKVDKKLQK